MIYYVRFRESSYDLVIFDQAIRSYSHFHLGISIIKGVHNGFGPHFSVLGDHFSPILATLAPLYWIYDGPQTLLIAQAVLFALAIPPAVDVHEAGIRRRPEGDDRGLFHLRSVRPQLADRFGRGL